METLIGWIVSGVWSIVSAILLFILKQQITENRELKRKKDEKNQARERALEEGMVCILRKHLVDEYTKAMEKKSITSKDLESGLLMYEAYKTLGGNGMIDHMNDEIQELPIRD